MSDGEPRVGFAALAQSHTIILLDDNKQIVKESEIDQATIAEKIDTPYLVLIPNSSTSIFIS
jgi:hypothetical protein